MAEPDDKDLDAAERALGTEPRDQESAAGRRARRDWDDRLAPLALAAPPAAPPADMFQRIERGLDGETETAKIIQLAERRARRWRAMAIATGGIAACLIVVVAALLGVLTSQIAPPATPRQSYVALVTQDGRGGPALVVEIDFDGEDGRSGTVMVRSLRVAAPEGRDLELWRVPPGGMPQSLGLVETNQPFFKTDVAVRPGDTLAVSIEPPGGSKSGVPTGPVILSGPLVEAR